MQHSDFGDRCRLHTGCRRRLSYGIAVGAHVYHELGPNFLLWLSTRVFTPRMFFRRTFWVEGRFWARGCLEAGRFWSSDGLSPENGLRQTFLAVFTPRLFFRRTFLVEGRFWARECLEARRFWSSDGLGPENGLRQTFLWKRRFHKPVSKSR